MDGLVELHPTALGSGRIEVVGPHAGADAPQWGCVPFDLRRRERRVHGVAQPLGCRRQSSGPVELVLLRRHLAQPLDAPGDAEVVTRGPEVGERVASRRPTKLVRAVGAL